MAVGEDFVDVQEAARLLGLSVQHVRRLAEEGKIVFAARGLVDRTSIRLYLAERAGSRTVPGPSRPPGLR
jgi:excisionase family DNA binding protein